MVETLIRLETQDKAQIALWKRQPEKKKSTKHVVLTHGTFSNKKICNGITLFLVEQGYTCWIMEWRNHGDSAKTKAVFNFETIALNDFLAVFDFLLKEQKIDSLDCVTHSGGGVCLSMFLAQHPTYQTKINRMALFCCQSFGAAHNWRNYTKIFVAKYLTFLLREVPAKALRLGDHNEHYFFMKLWFNWNLKQNFKGANGVDYLKALSNVKVPILSICAQGDTFIAPIKGCARFLAAFDNPKNKLLIYSKENGHLEDYNHSRILHSRNAQKEIWPEVLNWLQGKE